MKSGRDKYLTEAMGGMWLPILNMGMVKGPEDSESTTTRFGSWSGFGKLWTWAQQQEWWGPLWFDVLCEHTDTGAYCQVDEHGYQFDETFVHPDRFADALYAFLQERSK